MNKARWLLWGNVFLFITFVVQVVTSLILYFVIMTKFQEHIFYLIHAYNGFLFIALGLLHIWLHWRVIKHVYFE